MIGTIEQAIIDKIKAATSGATPALGYTLPTVQSYGGELEGPATEIAKRFPATLVMFAGIVNAEHIGGEAWKYTARFAVIVGNKDRRNNTAARHGVGAGDAGSYQMVIDMLRLLIGSDLGLEIEALTPGRVVALANAKTVSIYSAEVETSFIVEHLAADSDLDTFATLNIDWDIPPFGNVSTELPAADADATDTINPETE